MVNSAGVDEYRVLSRRLKQALLLAFLAWTLVIAGALYWCLDEDRSMTLAYAREEAMASYNKDLVFRRWNAWHGGVYVPMTADTPPNPYLVVPNRDVETASGVRLTLVNPAYMTRQVHELSREESGIQGHITSLKPIRPGNEPDPWEAQALKSFERGVKEVSGVVEIEGRDYFRLMRPLLTEERCLKCHAKQGYAKGDVRGGLSVAVPMDRFWESFEEEFRRETIIHFAFWALGVAGLIFVGRTLFNNLERVEESRASLATSEEKYRLLTEMSPNGIFIQREGRVVFVNRALLALLGATDPLEVLDKSVLDDVIHPDFRQTVVERIERSLSTGEAAPPLREVFVRVDGSPVDVEVSAVAITYLGRPAMIVIVSDISDRIKAQKARDELQAQVMQSQKVEAIGRLAGGVAHDFNNMLGVILGHAELALSRTLPEDPLHEELTEIQSAAARSAQITRQLLAFARKQTIAPRVLDLNEVVSSILKMIRRLIGEDIDLLWKPGHGVSKVKMDPSQMDQLLANLATNARDAIEGVGKVTIETDDVTLDGEYCAGHPGFQPGRYALLTVSDDGCGIEPERLKHIFEPFYTTKGVGSGTGLGLATVFGIVKQNGGFINVYSEPGHGSTFRIYLCALEEGTVSHEGESPRKLPRGGDETILLVEDEGANLRLGVKLLTSLGYRVLSANLPAEALMIADETEEEIALLVTDVVMPGMNGRELAEELSKKRPSLKCLYMSGYTANVIAHRGVLEKGVNFVAKPFNLSVLAAKVREVLDG